MEAKRASTPGPDPEIVLRVFGDGPHTGVRQALSLTVGPESRAVEACDAAAVRSRPDHAIVRSNDGRQDVVGQAVLDRKRAGGALLELVEAVAVCTYPQVVIAIGKERSGLHPRGDEVEPS